MTPTVFTVVGRGDRASSRRARAFSMVELMVALAIGAVLSSAAVGVLVVARASATEASARAQMARDGQLVMDNLERDLAYLGAGVPLKANADTAGAAVGKTLVPDVRRGLAQNLVFVGDLPYPNAEVPGIASVSRINLGLASRILAVTDEISGPCTPFGVAATAGFQCATSQTTLVPGTFVAADDCKQTQPLAKTCPWGMHKWEDGSGGDTFLTFVGIDGTWYRRKISGINAGGPLVGVDANKLFGIQLSAGFPGAGAENLNPTLFLGAGYGAVLDRVFYALEDPGAPGVACATNNCTLFRRQCWGDLGDPLNANFPVDGTGFYGTTQTPNGCAAGTDGTGWEVLATGIASLSFSYFTNSAALAAPLNAADRDNVRAVQIDMTFTKRMPGTTRSATVNMQRRFYLNNREHG